jgi:hypothetical protein
MDDKVSRAPTGYPKYALVNDLVSAGVFLTHIQQNTELFAVVETKL